MVRVAKALVTIKPSWNTVSVRVSPGRLGPGEPLSVTTLYRKTLEKLDRAFGPYARKPAELLSAGELAQLRGARTQVRLQLRTHDRGSIFGRVRRSWRAMNLRLDRGSRQLRRDKASR